MALDNLRTTVQMERHTPRVSGDMRTFSGSLPNVSTPQSLAGAGIHDGKIHFRLSSVPAGTLLHNPESAGYDWRTDDDVIAN